MRILKHICFLTLVLIIFTILFSCSGKTESSFDLPANQNTKISNSNTNQFDIAEFERNKELWTSKNIQNYKMIVGASGFLMNFPEEVLIQVRNGQTKSVKSLSKAGRNYTDAYKEYDNIEKLFSLVETHKKRNVKKLEVQYNATLGYPLRIYIDESGGSDDKLLLEVKSLEAIKKFENQL